MAHHFDPKCGSGKANLKKQSRARSPGPRFVGEHRERGQAQAPASGTHRRPTALTGGTSPRFCTRLPPPSRSGPKAPGGGGGGFLGGGLAAEEGLPRGLASRC